MTRRRRALFVDASQGASGDMILGALVDLGVPLELLRGALERLPLTGWRLVSRPLSRCSLEATKVDVLLDRTDHDHRGWSAIRELIDRDTLSPCVRERALRVFRRLIEAEAHVHGRSPEEVQLHEAGGIDAIVDVVGACVGIEHLEIDEIVVSPMTTGFGEVRCAHGVYPVPAPATTELVRGAPVRGGAIEAERLTPTGAAILTTLADRWAELPAMRLTGVGYGAGDRDLGVSPNMLRMLVGEIDPDAALPETPCAEVAVLECNVDDATPQALAFAAKRLLSAGALDVFTAPVTMKKGRQGHQLTVLARPHDLGRLSRQMLRDTPTLGLRYRLERRFELERRTRGVETVYGPVEVKIGTLNGRVLRVWPEYETCATLAERCGASLWEVQQAALAAFAATPEGKRTRTDSVTEGDNS